MQKLLIRSLALTSLDRACRNLVPAFPRRSPPRILAAAMRGRPFTKGISGNPGGRPKVVAELRALARMHAPDVIEELARLAVKARSETARVAAIRELLDRGYGKATQFLAGDDETDPVPTTLKEVFVKPEPEPQPDEGDLGPVGPKLR